MKNKKNLATIVMVGLCAVTLAVGTLALFTDHYKAEVSVTAGSVDLDLTENWQGDNSTVGANFKPGTGLILDYTLENGGNLAARVKETFVISSDAALNTSTPEFALYNADDVDVAADGTVSIDAEAQPIAFTPGSYTVDSTSWSKLTFDLGKSVLNGSVEEVGNYAQSKNGNYVLVFSNEVSNDFQGANVKIEYLAQGIQYTNTGDSTWDEAEVVSSKIGFGGENISVVPELNIAP